MRNKILLAGIALLSLPLALPAHAQNNGNDKQGSEKSKPADNKGGPGAAANRADKAQNKAQNKAKARTPDVANQPARSGNKAGPNNDRAVTNSRRQDGRIENFPRRTVENGRYIRPEPSFQGCPPGLAKKDNGCLPPGQARKFGEGTRWDRYSNLFGRNRSDDWRYDQGFAYRIDPATSLVQGIVPLLGGALFNGNAWPQSFTDYQVSPYYERYYGSGANSGVRYADGAIFRVNPETQRISSIAGLLTGDNWNVGSPAPPGYEVYNVPYNYRDRYADDEANYYRYNDGYVYQIDPTTQLVRQIIELVV